MGVIRGFPVEFSRAELQQQIANTQHAVAQLAESVITDLQTIQQHAQATRELAADLAARIDRLEAQIRASGFSPQDIHAIETIGYVDAK